MTRVVTAAGSAGTVAILVDVRRARHAFATVTGPMAYRLLALDLDGTLLRSDHSVDPRDIGAIRDLQRAGVTVTIVTGRLQSGATGAAEACAIEGTIACVEGSHLVELATNTTLVHHTMVADVAKLLRDNFTAQG